MPQPAARETDSHDLIEKQGTASQPSDSQSSTASVDSTLSSKHELAQAEDDLQWSRLAFELDLQAIPRQIVLNSVVSRYQDKELDLAVKEDMQLMLKPEIQQQISRAIETKLGVSLRVNFISKAELSCETPYQADIRIQEHQRQQAIQQIYADPVVQQLQKTFKAQLIENSVRKQTGGNQEA